jgi:MFS family permease
MTETHSKLNYGWIIVVSSTLMIAITYGVMYSYAVFFKPIADYFNWDRATVSLVYSASLIIRGAISIGIGWLADRYGPVKLMVLCGFAIGLGLALSSRVTHLWQLYLTYGVIESLGLSGAYGIGTAMTSRWFIKNRGLALGVVSTGSGLGTLFIVPAIERLIAAYDWQTAFLIIGVAGGAVTIILSFLLRSVPSNSSGQGSSLKAVPRTADVKDVSVSQAVRDPRMILLWASFLLFFFGIQIVMVHLVNYATDQGISPLVAATFISVIGAVSIIGRLATGTGSDKFGIHNTLILTRVFLAISLVWLIFTRSLLSFYVFTVLFSLAYGGEVPQVPLFIGRYYGTKAMATLVGLSLFIISIGGALGSWMGGKIFDVTGSYEWAFVAGALAGTASLILILIMRSYNERKNAL